MASFFAGFFIGAYTGAMVREEYTFPTTQKIQEAFQVFRSGEVKFKEPPPKPTEKIPSS